MKGTRTWLGIAVLAAWAAPAAAEDFRWEGRLGAGRTLEIKSVNGEVRATAGSGSEALVVARKHARRSDPAEVEIKVVEHAGGVTICAVYPSSGSMANECRQGSGGRMNTRDNDVQVDFEVSVPAGVRFVGRTVNGNIEAASLPGDVEAYTVNGGIRASGSGNVRGETVNGSINASMGKADWTSPLEFQTVNGSITVELPASVGAEVNAETVNGSITTDFPLTVQGRFTKRRLNGTIGSGGRELKLETVNGSIRLRKAS